MAYPDLSIIPVAAARAFQDGDERLALTLLARARDEFQAGTAEWAVLERLNGLILIHLLREVEGTFALERADAVLDGLKMARPDLQWLTRRLNPSGSLEFP